MKKINLITVFIVTASLSHAFASNSGQVAITSLDTYSRIIFPVKKNSEFKTYMSEDRGNQIVLELGSDLLLGHENISSLNDERISKIEETTIKESSKSETSKKKYLINLASDKYDFFSYTQNSPPAIIVDIWPAQRKVSPLVKEKYKRNIASVKRFSPQINESSGLPLLDIKKNFFIKLKIISPKFVYQGSSFTTEKEIDPGVGWEWSKPDHAQPAGLNFSLAKKLFENKQYALCIKTIQFARRDYKESPYFEEMEYMEALAYRYFGKAENNKSLHNKSVEMLKELMLKPHKAGGYLPFSNKIRIHFAAEAYRAGNWIEAISQFEFITNTKNMDQDPDYFGLMHSMAEAYFELSQFRRAERILRSLVSNNTNKILAAEAAYRIGNLLAHEGSFSKADEAIRKAIREYPEHEKNRQEAYFNLGEVNFQLKEYKKSEEYFNKYIELHSSNALTGLALFRLGEIAELNHKNPQLAKKYYLESINRFPYTESDNLSRIRIARIGYAEEKDIEFQIQFLSKMIEDSTNSKSLRNMAREMLVHYYHKQKEPNKAAEIALQGMKEVERPEYDIFENLYVQSLFSYLQMLNSQKDFKKALNLFQEKKTELEQVGNKLYMEVAKSYRGLNFLTTSGMYLAKYIGNEEKKNNRALASLTTEKNESLMIEAKVNFLKGRYSTTLDLLEKMNNPEALFLKAISLHKLQKLDEAKLMAEKALIQSEKKDDEYFIIEMLDIKISWAEKRRDYKEMELFVKEAIKMVKNKNERHYFLLADTYWYQQRHKLAMEAYRSAIENFPKSERLARAQYRLSISLISLGDRDSAVKILTELQNNSQKIWAESAKRELELISWEKKYSVILGDLPPSGLGLQN